MRVRIKTPCRLHFTLIDLNGELGRIDGGVGLSITEPNFELEFRDKISISSELKRNSGNEHLIFKTTNTELGEVIISTENDDDENSHILLTIAKQIVLKFTGMLSKCYNIKKSINFPLSIMIFKSFLPHIGLGSKTQLSLALASGIARILGLNLDIHEITRLVGRGGTSGIGYRAFERGGFIFDCGHKFGAGKEKESFLPSSASKVNPAKMILNYNFPEDWYILLVILKVPPGASNIKEIDIFQKHCPIRIEDVRELSHITIMQLLPGILEKDMDSFGSAISRMHEIGFKKIEFNLMHKDVKELVSFQKKNGVKCVGISSFGPAVYSFFESKSAREDMLKAIKIKFSDKILKTYLTNADNEGAKIKAFSE